MDVVPISIEHVNQFSEVIMTIAREDIFAIRPEDISSKSVYRFVERQIIEGAPMYVACDSGNVVGWCEISLSDLEYSNHTGILSMGVAQGKRRQGFGHMLIDQCLSAAGNIGLERVELSVLENNPDAQRFYSSVGFKVEGRKQRSLKINDLYHDEIIMALQLSDISNRNKDRKVH